MINISNNNIITLNQGDCGVLKLSLNAGTLLNPCYPKKEDFIKPDLIANFCFSLMEPNQKFEDGILRKIFNFKNCKSEIINDIEYLTEISIPIVSRDTECLLPGTYYYGLKARYQKADNMKINLDTIIKNTKLYILE